jgi:mannose-1-phosphate guanylyltransferase
MTGNAHLWAIVLAAGEGTRLRAITKNDEGHAVPKQFCSFDSDRSMLQWTLDRAKALVPEERIVCIVAKQHALWWKDELAQLPTENIVVQPLNRGTAAGLLLPLMHILTRDRKARVVVLPSDHYIADEQVLHRAIKTGVGALDRLKNRLLLLGITPDVVDPAYGWIVPKGDSNAVIYEVATFVEKPDLKRASALYRQGALWNSFMFVGLASTLLTLYGFALPELFQKFLMTLGDKRSLADEARVQLVYESLASHDFSRDVLEPAAPLLRVLPVPPCGWSDLGTPGRLERYLSRQNRWRQQEARRSLAEENRI